MNEQQKKLSKYLSFLLRHKPETLDLMLDKAGWTAVDTLLERMRNAGWDVDLQALQAMVKANDKQRFAFSPDHLRIRANQGHSIPVALGYTPSQPPDILYHGTAQRFVNSILANGIQRQQRHHVHLSPNRDTALKVGIRHGRPVVLTVKAGEMHARGYTFFLSENGVWLTDEVPADFIASNPDSQ